MYQISQLRFARSVIWLPLVQFSVKAALEAHLLSGFSYQHTVCRLWYPVGSITFAGLTVEVLVQNYPICQSGPKCVSVCVVVHYCEYLQTTHYMHTFKDNVMYTYVGVIGAQ